MRTVIYARFSSTLQNARSIEDQLALCRERCAREGWEIVGTFEDYAISGAAGIDRGARPGLNALLERVESRHHPEGAVEQVLAEATDRIARHQGDAIAIRERITFAGARIFTLSDGEVTDITATFRGLMDAQFRKDLAAKVKRGQRGAIAQKRSAAGIAYGYRRANRLDDDGELIRGLREIEPEQAAVVRRIFAEYAAGESPRAIAERLNADGVQPPQPRSGAASFWRASTLYGDRKRKNGILQNRLYIGELVFNRTRKVTDPRTRKAKILANPESEWLVEPVPHLRIVSNEAWQGVQRTLGVVQARPPEQSRRPKHLLSGLARCGTCGGSWIVRGPNRWGCARHHEGGAAACANNRTISSRKFERRVLHGLQSHMLDPRLIDIYVQEYHRDFARRAATIDRDRERLGRRQREAEAKVARLVSAIADGGEAFAEIKDALAKARTERDALAAEIGALEESPVVRLHPKLVESYRDAVANLNTMLAENPEARLEAVPRLRSLIDTIRLFPVDDERGVHIEVTGKLPAILGLATGKPVDPDLYGSDGAGEANCALPSFLRACV